MPPSPPTRPNIPLVTPSKTKTQPPLQWPGLIIKNPTTQAPWTPLAQDNDNETTETNDNEQTNDNESRTTETKNTTNCLSTLLQDFKNQFDTNLQTLVKRIETYVQEAVNELEDRLITSLAVITHNLLNTKTPDETIV